MRRCFSTTLCVLSLSLMSTPLAAQRTTGTIAGVVTDESGAVVPGVLVTLNGDGVPGSPTTVTSGTGAYRFLALAPGQYALMYVLDGFATLTREPIIVAVGGTAEIDVQLKVSTVAESITVAGGSPIVNSTSNAVGTNFNRDHVENIPQRRFTFFDLINQAAGVTASTSRSPTSQSLGSSTTENSYQLDGTDFTAPLTGGRGPGRTQMPSKRSRS